MNPVTDPRRAGDELEDHRAPLVQFCTGYLRDMHSAEDAAADAIARALAADPRPRDLRAWLLRTARNHCLNVLRDRAHERAEPLASEIELAASVTGASTHLARAEDRERLARLLGMLSEGERELLRLRYVEDLSREEIAYVVGADASVVKSRLYEALEKLRRSAGAGTLTQEER